jgi:hypothetical protein
VNTLLLQIIQDFVKNLHLKKCGPFSAFLGKSMPNIRPRIFSAAHIFMGPLLGFAAEISAGWEQCIYGVCSFAFKISFLFHFLMSRRSEFTL